MENNVLVKFDDEKEARAFEKDVIAILKKKKYSKYYSEYWYKEPSRWHFKSFLYVLVSLILAATTILFFVRHFQHKPEPITIIDTQIVTGNTYEVILNTNKLPAIWDMVYYYDKTISVQSWAKLNQIRVDADGIIRYNICLQQEVWCNDEYDGDYYWECKTPIYEWNNCFDISIIGSTEAELREWICKD